MRPVSPPPSRARAVLLVALIAYGLVTMTICLPSMQAWGTILDASPGAVQLTFSAFVLAYGVLQLLYGPLSDRLGRRPLMLVGLAVAGVASAAGAFATGIEALVAARTLQGVGCAACAVLGRAAIQDAFEGPQRTRVMAQVGMAMGLCPPLATVIGGAPLSYVFGNFLTSRLARHGRDMRMRAVGQALTLTGIVAMIGLALLDVRSGLAFTGPLVLFGIGHGLLMPPTLVATVGLLPALAGAAAGIAGVSQQLVGAVGGYAVGGVPQDGPVGLGLLMAAFTLGAIAAQAMLPRGRPQ
jgi:MFS family permease